MAPDPLTPGRILEATEEVLRRHGPGKATVVDVARTLGVSHGSVYRHFGTKAALREAVVERWLDRATEPLRSIADGGGPADRRMEQWLGALFEAKRRKVGDDPQLFATYAVLAAEAGAVVDGHIEDLVGQLAGIVQEGRDRGVFDAEAVGTSRDVARAVFDATSRFHDPSYAAQWSDPQIEDAFASVLALVSRSLRP